jgi:hypothetical protein
MSLVDIKLGEEIVKLADGTDVMMPVQVRPTVAEFIKAIASKHPTWEFKPAYIRREYEIVEVAGRQTNQVKNLVTHELTVMQGKVELGNIGAEDYGARKFYVSNPRIRQERQRGSVTRTGDLKKALKLVDKTFFPKTDAEKVKELTSRAKDMLSTHVRKHRNNVESLWRDMQASALDFVRLNMDEYAEFVTRHSHPVRNLNMLEGLIDARRTSKQFSDNYEAGSACYVAITGDTFHFTFVDKEPITFARDVLPPEVRTRVGMLKLVPVLGEIPDVGVKCDEEVYLINMPNNVRLGETYGVGSEQTSIGGN